jgi:hypothetical protein
MSVAFGLSPREVERVADEAPGVLAAMRDEYARRWTTTDELLAGIYEVTHALYVATLAAGGVKQRDLPKPVRVPRPGDEVKKKKVASSSELAGWIRGRGGRS